MTWDIQKTDGPLFSCNIFLEHKIWTLSQFFVSITITTKKYVTFSFFVTVFTHSIMIILTRLCVAESWKQEKIPHCLKRIFKLESVLYQQGFSHSFIQSFKRFSIQLGSTFLPLNLNKESNNCSNQQKIF